MGKGKRIRHRLLLGLGGLLLVLLAWWWWSRPAHPQRPAAAGGPVAAVAVVAQDVPVYIDALGTVTPSRSVSVSTQVNGILATVEFQEGQAVRKQRVGVVSQQAVVTQQLLLLQSEQSLRDAQGQLSQASVALIQSLGGGWAP